MYVHVCAVKCYKHVCALLERSYRKAVGDRPRINVLYLTSEIMRLSRKQAGAKDKYGESNRQRLSIIGSRVVAIDHVTAIVVLVMVVMYSTSFAFHTLSWCSQQGPSLGFQANVHWDARYSGNTLVCMVPFTSDICD